MIVRWDAAPHSEIVPGLISMLPIDRILAPNDFSPHAEGATRAACALANRLGASVHLLHVLSDVVVPAGPDPMLVSGMPPEYYREVEQQAADTLGSLIRDDWPKPAGVTVEVRWGDPVEQIRAYATEHAIDLVVVATHGRTGLAHVLLGSVAERIVRESPCPVLTIRDRAPR